MIKRYFKTLLIVILVVIGYTILLQFLPEFVVIGVAVAVFIAMIVYYYIVQRNPDGTLESLCDAEIYKAELESRYRMSNTAPHTVRKAYQAIYEGKFDTAETYLKTLDETTFDPTEKEYLIYHVSLLKVLYNNDEQEKYIEAYERLSNAPILHKEELKKEIFYIPVYMMREQYKNAKEALLNIIPQVKKRIYIVELEFYLVQVYFELGEKENAIAVLDFMAKKNYKNYYTKQMKQLLKEID